MTVLLPPRGGGGWTKGRGGAGHRGGDLVLPLQEQVMPVCLGEGGRGLPWPSMCFISV